MRWKLIELPAMLLAAVALDMAVAPALLGGRCWFLFLPATVVLTGMRLGRTWGWAAGWLGALMAASLSAEPLGLAMLRLGLLGFVSGFLAGLPVLVFTPIAALIAGGLLLVHELGMALLAAVVWGVAPRPSPLALALTWIALALWLSRRPIQPGLKSRGKLGATGPGAEWAT